MQYLFHKMVGSAIYDLRFMKWRVGYYYCDSFNVAAGENEAVDDELWKEWENSTCFSDVLSANSAVLATSKVHKRIAHW